MSRSRLPKNAAPANRVNKGVKLLSMPLSALSICVCPAANRKAGMPLPTTPVPSKGSQYFFSKAACRKSKGLNASHAMPKRAKAICQWSSTGRPSWKRPRFIRMKELPQIRASVHNSAHFFHPSPADAIR